MLLTGDNLDLDGLQIFFDVQPATIATPPAQRKGSALAVFVPGGVLGGTVSAVASTGTATLGGFHSLGVGHPDTLALRGQVQLGPRLSDAVPLAGGQTFALVDGRFGALLG